MPVLIEIAVVALLALAVWRLAPAPWRGRGLNLLKAYVTVRAFWLLLDHKVAIDPSQITALHLAGRIDPHATHVPAWLLILAQVQQIRLAIFLPFVLLAAGVKFVGILASMARWRLLLIGQGIELPFRHIFGSFLIGRFIGTFLPSTAGLDGYKLYDAARFSGRTVEATAATAIEKVIGVFGIFLSFLVALPFGIAIFGERGPAIAATTVPVALGLIGGLLLLLWYPGLVQWVLENVPLPGRARLEALVMRISRAAAAYRDKKTLVLAALGLSFVVHFTTAAMYYFTALAIGARGAEFWPIAFGSSIQIFATVMSPFTIAGEGIREAAQYVLLGHWIGPAAAIVSAALGFWAAEALTLFGGLFWWTRGPDYHPSYCRVDGEQVDYAEAARAALALEGGPAAPERRRSGPPPAPPAPLPERLREGLRLGLGAGLLAGLIVGLAETGVIAAEGFGDEAQVLWYGPAAYAFVLGLAGLVGGGLLALLPLDPRELRGWVPALTLLGGVVPVGLAIALFRVRRDVFHEHMPPVPVWLALLGGAAVLALAIFLWGPRLFERRLHRLVRPLTAAGLAIACLGAGAVTARLVRPPAVPPPVPAAIAPALRDRPNLLLVMIDTLRADVLDCYGGPVRAPALCGLAADGGTRFTAFSHASWTKPSTATLLSSLLPSSHGAVSKTAVLPDSVELVSEALHEAGYVTGGIVSNINLAPSFGFDQGYDEYRYLAPDYLAGAKESSSKLILYQVVRKVWFRVHPGLRVSDFYQDASTVNAVAFDWLERHRSTRFFLFLHYMDVHDPYFEHPYNGHAVARVANEHPDPARASELRALYEGEVRWVDRHVGELLARLRALGLYDDTLIVITADHGEEFQEHGGWWHGQTLYDEQIHVPLLVHWPHGRREAPPVVDDHLVRLIDVAPTLLRRAGAPIPAAMQGVDLALGLKARDEAARTLFAEEDHEGNVLSAVRTSTWKLIEANPGNPRGLAPLELYQVAADPGEKRNLASEHPEMVARLRSRAEEARRLARSRAVAPVQGAHLTRDQCERLRVLGYVKSCEGVE